MVEHRPYSRRGAPDPWRRVGRRTQGTGRRDARSGWPRRADSSALSARAVGRPAAPRRTRPHPAASAACRNPRRANLGPRYVGTGNGPQPVAATARAVRTYLSLHLARFVDRQAVLRPGSDHVSRAHRGNGAGGRAVRGAAPPLYAGIAWGCAARRTAYSAAAG